MDVVGIFDTSDSSFTTVSTGALTHDLKFHGAAAVGTKVVFAPYDGESGSGRGGQWCRAVRATRRALLTLPSPREDRSL